MKPFCWPTFLAVPFAALYGLAVLLRRSLYDYGWFQVSRVPVPTIAVGGLEAGGSGKTPVVGWLLQTLLEAGCLPGLLTRGYRRTSQGLVVRQRGAPCTASYLGDESAMLVAAGFDVPVAAVAQRIVGAKALLQLGCDSLVLDDAFVHRAIHRDINIVVLNGEQPFGNGHLLPWGSLREPPSSLKRADVVWLHHRQSIPKALPAWLKTWCSQAYFVQSQAVIAACTKPDGTVVQLSGQKIVAAAGIAKPENFAISLQQANAQVCDYLTYPDHHVYSIQDMLHLCHVCRQHQACAVVVTPKDAIKLTAWWLKHAQDVELWVQHTRVYIQHEEQVKTYFLTQIRPTNKIPSTAKY